METRAYEERDRNAAKDIFAQYWTDPEFLDELEKNLDDNKISFYIAKESGEAIGIAGFRIAPEYLSTHATKKPAELYIVASKKQNKGTGTVLVNKLIDEAKKLNFTEMVCYSPETHSSSWNFYQKLGFIEGGIINDPEDGYPGMLWRKTIS
jgi:L-amino acid N-acyltransferase YncA